MNTKNKKKKNNKDCNEPQENRIDRIKPEVIRRILRFINAARTPQDLFRAPQQYRDTQGEHGPRHDAEHEGHQHPASPKIPKKLDRDVSEQIICEKPPFGYNTLKQFVTINPQILERWILDILPLFSAPSFGEWSAPIPIEVGGVEISIQNAALLRTGKVLLIPSGTDTLIWDPSGAPALTLKNSATTGLTANLFCSGHSFLSDGTLLVAGGGGGSPGAASSVQAWKFNPVTETWTQTGSDMAHKRWYPTVLTMGDEPGRALIISGWTGGVPATAPEMEIYSEATDNFAPVTVSGPVGDKVGPQTYPGMHLLPGGEIFYAPVGFGNCSQSAVPHGGTEASGYFVFDGPSSGSWTDTGVNVRTKGMSVLLLQSVYPFVRVLTVGVGDAGQSGTAQTINLSTLSPSWSEPFSLLQPRVHPNAVLLPDGTVFICGGMEETGTPPTGGMCELYDPAFNTLTEMADVQYPRHYHSAGLLLPSGQVMVAGGASPGGCALSFYNTIEVYSPPYLFRGARPTLSPLPALVHHGDTFEIETPDADDIVRITLVRPMAVTHQTDSEQRVVSLPFVQTAPDRLSATMPNGLHPHGMAPRGYYLLFILNADGVPSVGQFILLH